MTGPGPVTSSRASEFVLVLVALQFLTRVPVPLRRFEPAWLTDCVRWFPLVGAFVGAVGAGVALLALRLWPAPLAVVLSMAATVVLTGAFHEDGLADTCDGLGGAVPRERALAIMKDSRLGTYGACGLVGILAAKATALTALAAAAPAASLAAAIVLAHAASRAAPVALLRVLPYAGDAEHAKAKPLARSVSGPGLVVALALAAVAAAASAPWLGAARVAAASAAAVLAAAACGRWFHRRLGGFTGDTLGAIQQLTELAFYLVLAAR